MTSDQTMRALADSATQGPWTWASHTTVDGDSWAVFDPQDRALASNNDGWAPDAEFIAACREWVPDALRRLDNARVIARKLLEASGAYSTLDATPEFPEAYQLAQDLYEALDGDK